MDEAEARKFLEEPAASAAATTPSPQAVAATAIGEKPRTQKTKLPELDFITRNQRDIPIDLDLEPVMNVRSGVLLREKPEDKIKFLESIFGAGNARLADNGEPLVTVLDKKRNGPVEIPALGHGFQPEDVEAHIVAAAPEALGALGGFALGGKVPTGSRFLKFASEMIGSALGQETAGAAKDIGGGTATPLDQLLQERVKRVPIDATMNALGVIGAKVPSYAVTPFRGVENEIRTGFNEAREYFSKEFGVLYPMSPGDITGSTALQRVEATMSRMPGSSAAFERLQKAKITAFREIQNKMLAGRADPAAMGFLGKIAEDVGEDAIKAIKMQVDPMRRAEQLARSEAEMEVNRQVTDEIGSATGTTRQLYPEKVGGAIRANAVAQRDAFRVQNTANYTAAYDLPGGRDKILEPTKLSSDAKKLLDELPSPEITTTKPSPVLGPTGQPVMVTTTENVLQKEFVDPEVVRKLEALIDLDSAKFSLRDLVRIRTDVDNAIARGEALPGVETHYMGKIRGLLTSAIEESTDALADPSLKLAWQKANAFYKAGVGRFEDRNIARLFKEFDSGAFVQDEDIVRNIKATEYESFKKFLGIASPEFQSLQRGIIDDVLQRSSLPGGELIDGPRLVSNLNAFVRNNRAVAEDILGTDRINALTKLGRLAQTIQDGDLIDKSKFTDALVRSRDLTTAVNNLVATQRNLNQAYRSQIIKDIGEGKLGETFDATEFVNRFYKNASPKELDAIMGMLPDESKIELRRKVIEEIFYDARRNISNKETSRIGENQLFRQTSTGALEDVFGNEQNQIRLRKILGDDSFRDFQMLAKLLRSGEVAEKTFAATGGFAAQMQVGEMLRGGVFGYLSDFLKQKIAAVMYSNPAFRAYLGNRMFAGPEGQVRLARTIVTSQPFLTAIYGDATEGARDSAVGKMGGDALMNAIYNSIDLYEQKGGKGVAPLRQQDWTKRLIQERQEKENKAKVFLLEEK